MPRASRRIGIDVGGTHTDAVVMTGGEVIAAHKAETTPDVAAGIVAAAEEVLSGSGLPRDSIDMVAIGTTQFTNAVVQRQGLARVAAIRIGAQSTSALPPYCDWPEDLREAVDGDVSMFDGGHEYDGRPIAPFDEASFSAYCRRLTDASPQSIAVSGVFASVNPDTENYVGEILQTLPGVEYVSLSHELGGVGLYQRENAALLNAALMPLASRTMAAFHSAFDALGLSARLYISQNDGTLMDADFAIRYPVLTMWSGPTNSMRGAALLTGKREAIVIDVGGSTADIGMLIGGFPRRSGTEVEVGGVIANFRMPDILSIGVAGGSIVREEGRQVGPDSVGYQLRKHSRVFGGDTLTATDIACARGRVALGEPALMAALPADQLARSVDTIHMAYAEAVERIRAGPDPLPLIAVGGANFLVPDKLPGVTEVLRPEHSGVANAVGAAMGMVGGETELVYTREGDARARAHSQAQAQATQRAVDAGADSATIEIIEVDETPISYLEDPVVRLRVKAMGEMSG